jgi:hypothetical protein
MKNKIYFYNNRDDNTQYDLDLIRNNSSNIIINYCNEIVLTRFILSNLFGYRIIIKNKI